MDECERRECGSEDVGNQDRWPRRTHCAELEPIAIGTIKLDLNCQICTIRNVGKTGRPGRLCHLRL